MIATDRIPPTYSRGHGSTAATATRVGDTVICDACGCRLTARNGAADAGPWYHYEGVDGRDARGCAVTCAEAAHRLA